LPKEIPKTAKNCVGLGAKKFFYGIRRNKMENLSAL